MQFTMMDSRSSRIQRGRSANRWLALAIGVVLTLGVGGPIRSAVSAAPTNSGLTGGATVADRAVRLESKKNEGRRLPKVRVTATTVPIVTVPPVTTLPIVTVPPVTTLPIVTVPPVTTLPVVTTVPTATTQPVVTTLPVVTTVVTTTLPIADDAELRLREHDVDAASGSSIEYCSTFDIAQAAASDATELVVVIHGTNRNACEYAEWVSEAGVLAGRSDIIVVAPRFATVDDPNMPADRLLWSSGGWKNGSMSRSSPLPATSSFEVLDDLITTVVQSSAFENVSTVTVVGHSAGGQFVNRYASSSPLALDAEIDFVVANPSSYLYLTSDRPSGDGFRQLTERERADCPGYNSYKYGLDDLYQYPAAMGVDAIRAQLPVRRVMYLLGELDTDPDANYLDTSCEALLQGSNRFDRGQNYYHHLQTVFGAGSVQNHTLTVVPAVGHQAQKMFTSPQGVDAIFG